MMRPVTKIDELANEFLDTSVANYPTYATYLGMPGNEKELDDLSPSALERDYELAKATLRKLSALEAVDDVDLVTKDALSSSLEGEIAKHESGLVFRELNNIASPAQGVRDIFDLVPTKTAEDWENIAARMRKVGDSLAGYAESLRIGFESGNAPAKRQLEEVINQVKQINNPEGFFHAFAKKADVEGGLSDSLKAELADAAKSATEGYSQFGDFLAQMMPKANSKDAIGRDLYAILSKKFLGAAVDFDETYEWGKEELARVIAEQNEVANQILPGANVAEAVAHLEKDPSTKLHGTDALRAWMQELSDKAIEELGRTHFDIAPELRNLECMIAPTQHGGIYYTGPSDDFSRPGRMWWSVPQGVDTFDTWRETTTVYHEGVPGHHLQIGQSTYVKDTLNKWRRLASFTSGHG